MKNSKKNLDGEERSKKILQVPIEGLEQHKWSIKIRITKIIYH